MAAMAAEPSHWLCEERYGKVVSFKYMEQTERISRFLKPCARSSSEAERVASRAPLVFEVFSSRNKKWPPKVNFKGGAVSREKWNNWVEKLSADYCVLWNQSGICDAIMSSCFDIRCNKEIVLGLAEFWCPETNTFVFPWGEATITLEDVMILGGFTVLGEPIKKPVTDSVLVMAVNAMRGRKSAMWKERSKKASHGAWMSYFMKNDSALEHMAFLSHWLSRYVFPSHAKDTISNDVFPIAAHLSQGTQLALAPAVLAGLYKNLSLLKEQAFSSFDEDEITVFAPFQLVQMWVYEHFPHLVLRPPNILKLGESRVARWHKLNFKIDTSNIYTVFNSGNSFEWRPYAADISNWNHSSYYRVKKKHLLIDTRTNSDQELQSYAICLQMSHLVGLDCKERYMPHRVAMQFGMDQDLPGEFTGLNFVSDHVYFFVPPMSFEPSVSARYFDWWKESEFFGKGKSPIILRNSSVSFHNPSSQGETSTKEYNAIEIEDDTPKFDECKDSFDVTCKSVCQSGFPTRESESSESSPSIEEVKVGGDCYASAESFGSKSPKSLTQSSACGKCHASVTHKSASIERCQDPVKADHVAVAENSKQMSKNSEDYDENSPLACRLSANAMSRRATSDEVYSKQDIRKRNFSTAMEGSSDCIATISMINGDSNESQREPPGSTRILKKTVKEDRKDCTNICVKATTDVERRNSGIGHGNLAEGLVQDVSEEFKGSLSEISFNRTMDVDNNGSMAEVSFNGFMDVDNNGLFRGPTTFDKCDLEKRIENLEKLLGISPNVG